MCCHLFIKVNTFLQEPGIKNIQKKRVFEVDAKLSSSDPTCSLLEIQEGEDL